MSEQQEQQEQQQLVDIPHPTEYPIIGNLNEVDTRFFYGFQERLAKIYGEIYSMKLGGPRTMFVNSYSLANECCDEKRFSKNINQGLKSVRDGVHDGLLTAYHGELAWSVAHRILIPAFGPLTIRNMFDEMRDIATQLAMKLARAGPEYVMDAADDFTRLTLDTIALCSMDYRFNSFYRDKQDPFVETMAGFLNDNNDRSTRFAILAPLYRAQEKKYWENIQIMRDTSDRIVKYRRAHPSDRKDLLAAMLNGVDPQTGSKLDDASITNNLITFLIAGHETTSGTLSFTFYELLTHPEAYMTAQKEIDEVCGKGPITVDHLSKLRFMNAVLRETLRLHSPLTTLAVTPLYDQVLGGKYAVKKGEPVNVIINRMHRDPEVWGEDVLEWKPERMVDERFNELPKNAWKPFGNGARACIGRPFAWQEALLVMAMLLQNFNFYLADPTYVLSLKQKATIKPKDFYMKMTLRHGYTAVDLEHALGGKASSSKQENSTPSAPIAATGKPMSIFYGSNTGTSESFANRIASSASSHGFKPTVQALDAAKENLKKDVLNVIVSASFEGEAPDNARHFTTWLEGLKGDDQPLKDVPYVVFGCGHSDWSATYQKIPKLCDTKIEAYGGKRIAARGEANAAGGDMFSEFEAWEDDVFWPSVKKNYGGDEVEKGELTEQGLQVEVSHTRASLRSDVSEAKVISKRILTAPGATSQKISVEIKLPTEQEYRTGDYLAILPTNHKDNVARAMKYFGMNWDSNLKVTGVNSSILPEGTSIPAHDLFSGYIELTQPATKRNLATCIAFAQSEETKQKLQQILDKSFNTDIVEKRLSILDLLEQHPDIKLPLGQFLAMAPPMRVRQYSISSSPLVCPDTCTITFSILDAPARSGHGIYHGTATNYLATLEPGEILHVAVKPSHAGFHLPADIEKTPVIMVASGTGIAPFRGFIQERAAQRNAGRKLATAILFHGCRAPGEDNIYADELKDWENSGVVKSFKAFSRQADASEGCKYVQDRVWREREEVRQLFRDGARVYMCGAGHVGAAVNDTICNIYAEGHKAQGSEKSEEEVKQFLDKIRSERYAVDVFD